MCIPVRRGKRQCSAAANRQSVSPDVRVTLTVTSLVGCEAKANVKVFVAAFVHTHRGGRHDQALRVVIASVALTFTVVKPLEAYGEDRGSVHRIRIFCSRQRHGLRCIPVRRGKRQCSAAANRRSVSPDVRVTLTVTSLVG